MRNIKTKSLKCLHCRHANFCRRHSKIRLIERDSLHSCMWINQHIHSAYRPLDLPWYMCVKSILQWNNETINIWSHLIGFIYIGYLQYWSAIYALPQVNAHNSDYVIMGISMLCSQVCMLLSTSYHMFGCQSVEKRRKWLLADQFGISTGLMGIYLSGIYTSFYHFPKIQQLYIVALMCLLFFSALIPFHANSTSLKTDNLSTSLKITKIRQNASKEINSVKKKVLENSRIGLMHFVYIGLALFGIYPTLHWIQLHGGISNPHVIEWLPKLIILFLLCGIAFLFYATLLPERLYPGKFDYIGCSHQWWHLFILVAMIYWHYAGIQLLTHYYKNAHIFAHYLNEITDNASDEYNQLKTFNQINDLTKNLTNQTS